MNPPRVYTRSQSWTPLPPPSPYHLSGSSLCTSPKHPVSCIKPGLAIHFLYDIIHVSMPFSQIIPPPNTHTQNPKDCSIHVFLFCCLTSRSKHLLISWQQSPSASHLWAAEPAGEAVGEDGDSIDQELLLRMAGMALMKMTGMAGVSSFSRALVMTLIWVSQWAPAGTACPRVRVVHGEVTGSCLSRWQWGRGWARLMPHPCSRSIGFILEPPKMQSATIPTISPSICHEVMGPDAMILVFWMLSFKPNFHSPLSLSSRGSLVLLHFLP